MIDQKTTNKILAKCFKKLNYKINDTNKITDTLDRAFKKYGIRFLTHIKELDQDEFEIYGYFCPDEKKDKIVIIVGAHENGTTIEYTTDILFEFSAVIQHELVHLDQEKKRGHFILRDMAPVPSIINSTELDTENMTDYLSNTDETDAYAYQTVLEMSYLIPNDKLTLKKLFETVWISSVWELYQDHTTLEVRKRLIRKICKWYYQNIRWLNT